MLVADGSAAGVAIALQERLGPLEELVGHNGFVFAIVDLVLVFDLADVRDVSKQRVEAIRETDNTSTLDNHGMGYQTQVRWAF